MKPLLCLRHEEPDHLGTAADVFAGRGLPVEYVDLWKDPTLPPPADASALVVLGGVMNVDEIEEHRFLAPERDFIARSVTGRTPFLGICLGAQLLARALGADVHRAPRGELGFFPLRPTERAAEDPVMGCLRDGDRMFQWHRDTFGLPPGARLLARGDGVANQAFAVGERAWGVQFHPEVTLSLLEDWLAGEDDEELRRRWGRGLQELRADADRHMSAQVARAEELFGRFADVVTGASR